MTMIITHQFLKHIGTYFYFNYIILDILLLFGSVNLVQYCAQTDIKTNTYSNPIIYKNVFKFLYLLYMNKK